MEIKALPLRIRLSTIRCIHQKNDRKGTDAYLWVIFFKAGGHSLKITDSFRLEGNAVFKFSEGSHGNLGELPFRDGDTFRPGTELGEWETAFEPLVLPHFEANITGVAGCLAILMEKKNLTARGAEAAHQFLNEYLEKSVQDVIEAFDPRLIDVNNLVESVKDYFISRLTSLADQLQDEIGEVVAKSQTLLENIWTLLGKDRLIGYHLWAFSHESLMEEGGREEFADQVRNEEDHETWEFSGYAEIINKEAYLPLKEEELEVIPIEVHPDEGKGKTDRSDRDEKKDDPVPPATNSEEVESVEVEFEDSKENVFRESDIETE